MASTSKRRANTTDGQKVSSTTTPLIFISHDSRDAEIAEAFSKLLSNVSMGVLKSFRSSDQKGTQGIEYGTEWYGEIMRKLDSASDVVCLLTPRSLERPWILYEAGVAKGKLDKTVLGVALGVPLKKAATGPFAQFQNCDDSDEKLTTLVMQLCQRVPNAEPNRDVIKQQVSEFKTKVTEIFEKVGSDDLDDDTEETSVAELFEEIKVMFQDLPGRIDHQFDPRRRRKFRRFHPMMMEELMFMEKRSGRSPIGLLMIFSLFKDDMPWIYEIGYEIYKALKSRRLREAEALFEEFRRVFDFSMHSGFIDESMGKEGYILRHEVPELIARTMSSARADQKRRKLKPSDRPPALELEDEESAEDFDESELEPE